MGAFVIAITGSYDAVISSACLVVQDILAKKDISCTIFHVKNYYRSERELSELNITNSNDRRAIDWEALGNALNILKATPVEVIIVDIPLVFRNEGVFKSFDSLYVYRSATFCNFDNASVNQQASVFESYKNPPKPEQTNLYMLLNNFDYIINIRNLKCMLMNRLESHQSKHTDTQQKPRFGLFDGTACSVKPPKNIYLKCGKN